MYIIIIYYGTSESLMSMTAPPIMGLTQGGAGL